MIKLTKGPEPKQLQENKEAWTAELHVAIQQYGSYSNIPKAEKDSLLRHYKSQEVRDKLIESSHEKCAFCELKPGESGNVEVEHFAPKSLYPHLTFEWTNLLPACRKCNGTKDTHDTVNAPIVNPYEIDPANAFKYEDILMHPRCGEYRGAAKLTIQVCGLNSVRLMKPRADILVNLRTFSQSLEEAIEDYESADTELKKANRKRKLRESLEVVSSLTDPKERLSGFCQDFLQKCAVYKQAKAIIES